MKGIGIFVLLLLVALGVAMFVVTRPPNRNLDAQGRAWVARFSAWRADVARPVNQAEVVIGISRGEKLPARLIEPLRGCTVTLAKLGAPPSLLEGVVKNANAACGEVEYGLSVYARYGSPALATTKLHLHRAGRWLAQAEINLHQQLGE
ncbi:MAG: hypothetical protein OEW47_07365 [Thermoleophilia bacterium]|nr:hypothetical protein [Thermoleophilia bacterium]